MMVRGYRFVGFLVLVNVFYFTNALPFTMPQSAAALACERDPSLPYCAINTISRDDPGPRTRRDEKDVIACKELRTEYRETCTRDKLAVKNDEFCAAYENVCFRIPSGEPDQAATRPPAPATTKAPQTSRGSAKAIPPQQPPSHSHTDDSDEEFEAPPIKPQPRRDYTEFCKEYKQRFLYVCPDPFRFGQRAAVFCPIYSDRCNVPVPEKPVVPTQRPPTNALTEALSQRQRSCAQYRGFAIAYCGNSFALTQASVREGCAKYRRWCTRSG